MRTPPWFPPLTSHAHTPIDPSTHPPARSPTTRTHTTQGTASRISGADFQQLGADALRLHNLAYDVHVLAENTADAHAIPHPGACVCACFVFVHMCARRMCCSRVMCKQAWSITTMCTALLLLPALVRAGHPRALTGTYLKTLRCTAAELLTGRAHKSRLNHAHASCCLGGSLMHAPPLALRPLDTAQGSTTTAPARMQSCT